MVDLCPQCPGRDGRLCRGTAERAGSGPLKGRIGERIRYEGRPSLPRSYRPGRPHPRGTQLGNARERGGFSGRHPHQSPCRGHSEGRADISDPVLGPRFWCRAPAAQRTPQPAIPWRSLLLRPTAQSRDTETELVTKSQAAAEAPAGAADLRLCPQTQTERAPPGHRPREAREHSTTGCQRVEAAVVLREDTPSDSGGRCLPAHSALSMAEISLAISAR